MVDQNFLFHMELQVNQMENHAICTPKCMLSLLKCCLARKLPIGPILNTIQHILQWGGAGGSEHMI